MQIGLGVLVAGVFVWLMVNFPAFRRPGAIAAGAVVLAFTAGLLLTEREQRLEAARIQPDEIVLTDVDLIAGPRLSTLTGRIQNLSESYRVLQLDLLVEIFDCPDRTADLNNCIAIGQDDGIARLDVPPSQVRNFSAVVHFINVPAVEGFVRWDYDITAIRAGQPNALD